jgi:hypothetical protein
MKTNVPKAFSSFVLQAANQQTYNTRYATKINLVSWEQKQKLIMEFILSNLFLQKIWETVEIWK